MRISDWSSDVCSSDLSPARTRDPARAGPALGARLRYSPHRPGDGDLFQGHRLWLARRPHRGRYLSRGAAAEDPSGPHPDRKSVVEGKGVAVRVGSGGSRTINKKNKKQQSNKTN